MIQGNEELKFKKIQFFTAGSVHEYDGEFDYIWGPILFVKGVHLSDIT